MKKTVFLLMLGLMIITAQAQIKSAVYWTAPTMPAGMAEKLSCNDLLIVDYENLVNNKGELEKIKELNPKIKLLIYSNPMEVWDTAKPNRPLANDLLKQLPVVFRLKQANGKPVVFWQGMKMMNLSVHCPKVNGQNYLEYYAEWLLKILADSLINGYFQDNGTSTVSWTNNKIDADNNGATDTAAVLDTAWKIGVTNFLNIIRKAKGDSFIIITNKGEKTFFSFNNGVMFEKFPNNYLGDNRAFGWYRCIENAEQAGKYTIFQVDFKNLEFGLASSLLLDNVYFALGQNMQIPKEYIFPIGKPLGKMYQSGNIYCRDYQYIKIEVDPEKKIGRLIKK